MCCTASSALNNQAPGLSPLVTTCLSTSPALLTSLPFATPANFKSTSNFFKPTPRTYPMISKSTTSSWLRTITSFFDANLYHELISGKSVTGIIHQLNKTPIDWYSKLQSTVETATFGSEHVAARTCTEQVIDLRLTLRYLRVPINRATMVLGDNESVIISSDPSYLTIVSKSNIVDNKY